MSSATTVGRITPNVSVAAIKVAYIKKYTPQMLKLKNNKNQNKKNGTKIKIKKRKFAK